MGSGFCSKICREIWEKGFLEKIKLKHGCHVQRGPHNEISEFLFSHDFILMSRCKLRPMLSVDIKMICQFFMAYSHISDSVGNYHELLYHICIICISFNHSNIWCFMWLKSNCLTVPVWEVWKEYLNKTHWNGQLQVVFNICISLKKYHLQFFSYCIKRSNFILLL